MYLEKGARMGYSNGILTLAIGAITLLFIFRGNTERLIPLYTIGVFIPFALSQTGMVVHWIREYGKGFWKHSLANILGALICYAIVLILFLFRLGDIWPFFPIIAILMWMFLKIKKHYNGVAQQLRIDGAVEEHHYQGNIVLILVGNVTKANIGAISYARSIGDKVIAMHVSTKDTENKDKETEQEFKKYFPEIEMVHIQSPYSSITQSTIQYVDEVATQAEKDNATLTVMIPQFVPKKSLIHQRQLGADINTMSDGIRDALREDPDVIMVGELRDRETLEAALHAAETGHLVMATMHTQRAAMAGHRMISLFPGEQQEEIRNQISQVLRAVICQRLLRWNKKFITIRDILLNTHAVANLIRTRKEPQIISIQETQLPMKTLEMAVRDVKAQYGAQQQLHTLLDQQLS